APSQFPTSAQQGWAGDLFLRINPLTAGEHYVGKIVVDGHPWKQDVSWLASPIVAATIFGAAAAIAGSRFLRLRGGGSRLRASVAWCSSRRRRWSSSEQRRLRTRRARAGSPSTSTARRSPPGSVTNSCSGRR